MYLLARLGAHIHRTPMSRLLALCALTFCLAACDSGTITDPPREDDPLAEAKANLGEWTWIDVEGAQCRDGSATGFGVRLQDGATDLAIYLEGGGACFDATTCALNDPNFTEADFTAGVALDGETGIFSTGDANPVGDWNMVYVPYCTGDVHGGSAPEAAVPGVQGAQQFVGHQNMELYLDDVQASLDTPGQVLLTGVSAGGFGALVNFAEVADRFGTSQMTLLDDSGPIFYADDVFSPAIGGAFVGLYNFPEAFPSDASGLFAPDGLEDIYAYYADRYPSATFGLTSYLEDGVIRFFFGGGQPDGTITGDEYAAGLRDLRSTAPDRWATYYASGSSHTFLRTDARYFGTSAGVALNDWVGDLLEGTAPNVDPDIATVAAR